jgi:2-oxoglutarate dehydrogenase E1 component
MTRSKQNEEFARSAFLHGANAPYIEDLQTRYKQDPNSVDEGWRNFFNQMQDGPQNGGSEPDAGSWRRENWPPSSNGDLVSAFDGNYGDEHGNGVGSMREGDFERLARRIEDRIRQKAHEHGTALSDTVIVQHRRQTVRALELLRSYRIVGHLAADLDPLGLMDRLEHPELQIEFHGFTQGDLDTTIFLDGELGLETATLGEIVELMRKTYCRHVGFEFTHITHPEQRRWLRQRIEGYDNEITFTPQGKKAILRKILEAETFERFLDLKYTGTKRFGLDGGESVVPAMEQVIKRGGQLGLREIVIGMPHRGRLNVLANVMSKPMQMIFHEFSGGSSFPDEYAGSGDVKYHLGASSNREFDENKVHLSLAANPSHLEAVDPVVLGKVRAKQDQLGDARRVEVLPLLLHGDAAFAGQGVVSECFGMSKLTGYRTGGSIHFIVNNQIGFTTTPNLARSAPYPSSVAKMVGAPIFHVNGDDPEAVVHMSRVATEFRQLFHKPVIVDIFCYRRHGHNEADEPMFTQPKMYKTIRHHPMVGEIYSRKLVDEGTISPDEVESLKAEIRGGLDKEFEDAKSFKPSTPDWLSGKWQGLTMARDEGARRGNTGVSMQRLLRIGNSLTTMPPELQVHRTLKRVIKKRAQMIEEGEGIDWGMAEQLAFGTLLDEGFPVRLSGQDVERGTFSHRHAVINDQDTEDRYIPLNNLGTNDQGMAPAAAEIVNSLLSEYGVLGFEYGYSLTDPHVLTLWEAQFGDFANGAQIMFDQFLSAGERKWMRMSGLVCLLPHGYEGQGPEHSSARLERFLQMSAEDNWQVANCTTPANYFHILRRQIHRKFRKPLIMMSPKSLLRHKLAVSSLDEMGPDTTFHRILWDDARKSPGKYVELKPDDKIRRVVLCSGKVYYDLLEEREKRGIDDILLLRLEQLYPFPAKALVKELATLRHAEMIWCQEEPQNMGAWTYIQPGMEWVLEHLDARFKRLRYVGRSASAATATGLMRRHREELEEFLDEAMTID